MTPRRRLLWFVPAALALFFVPAQASEPVDMGTMVKTTEWVTLRDGVRLATDIYRPKTDRKVPLVLIRTPYGREGMAGALLPAFSGKRMALVIQDIRGRHDSEGVGSVFIDDAADGYETVEWLAAQPWSDGKVGTAGISAMGITQYLLYKNHQLPPHLTCQNVMAAPESLYHTIAYQGGSIRRALFYGWVMGQKYPIQNMHLILSNTDYNGMWRMMDISHDYQKVDIPVMHMAGWYDLYLPGNLNAFNGIREKGAPGGRENQHLVIGPWTHGGFLGIRGTDMGALKYPANAKYDMFKVVGWFQECLKGQDKGFKDDPRVRYYVMGAVDEEGAPGNEWRESDVWPVPHTPTPYYFHAGGKLSTAAPTGEGSTVINDDPANPVPTLGSRAHAEQREPVDLREIEKRDDVLVFSTGPLAAPVEVTGPIRAKAYFKTDVVDTDFVVRLSDVYPDGRSMLVTDGIARASKREGDDRRVNIEPGKDYVLEVDIWPTSLIFNKGHEIRVSVSGTNFPRFDVNHHNGRYHDIRPGELEAAAEGNIEEYVYTPDDVPDAKVAHTTLYLSKDAPSQIILPVVK